MVPWTEILILAAGVFAALALYLVLRLKRRPRGFGADSPGSRGPEREVEPEEAIEDMDMPMDPPGREVPPGGGGNLPPGDRALVGGEPSERERAARSRLERERPAAPAQVPPAKERYRFSAFYPEKVKPEAVGKILAYATLGSVPAREFAQEALGLMDLPSGVGARVGASEPVAVPAGRTITVTPNVPGLDFGGVTETRIQLWEEVQSAEFRFRAQPDSVGRLCQGSVDFWLEGLILASVPVTILVQEELPEFFRQSLQETRARPYRSVFPSYSRRDSQVVDCLELYAEAFGDRYLRDIRALRAGEEFDPRIQQFIEQADVFQLFWSRNAAESRWVTKEWQLGWTQRTSRPDPYFVRPVYWTPRPEPDPPDPLCTVHFARITI